LRIWSQEEYGPPQEAPTGGGGGSSVGKVLSRTVTGGIPKSSLTSDNRRYSGVKSTTAATTTIQLSPQPGHQPGHSSSVAATPQRVGAPHTSKEKEKAFGLSVAQRLQQMGAGNVYLSLKFCTIFNESYAEVEQMLSANIMPKLKEVPQYYTALAALHMKQDQEEGVYP